MNYSTHLGLEFTDADGVKVTSYQLLFNGKAVATADFNDGQCVRFLFADSHEEKALAWRKSFKWLACGLCHGSGTQTSYEDSWPCPPCEGKGGSLINE